MADKDRSLLRFFVIALLFGAAFSAQHRHNIMKRNYSDQSVRGYLAERTCWWNEVCKEEFHSKFRCRCPRWSYCRAPGRYYDAHCSMTRTGYIWTQPETNLGLEIDKQLSRHIVVASRKYGGFYELVMKVLAHKITNAVCGSQNN